MPRYVQLGEIPRKRHTQFRKPDGSLYAEQVFGTKGFSGIASILYHHHPPTQVAGFEALADLRPQLSHDELLHHRHLKTKELPAAGDPVRAAASWLLVVGCCNIAAERSPKSIGVPATLAICVGEKIKFWNVLMSALPP